MTTSTITTIEFHGDTIFAIEQDGRVFVAVAPICDALGLATRRQRDRIQRDPILSEGVFIMKMPSIGGPQDTLCLPLELLHGWLFTIDDKRVKAEARDRVLAYKRECYRVLFDHFHGQATTRVRARRSLPPQDDRITGAISRPLLCNQAGLEATLHPHQMRTLAAIRALLFGAEEQVGTTWEALCTMTGGLSRGNVQRNIRFLAYVGLIQLTPEGAVALPAPGTYEETVQPTRH